MSWRTAALLSDADYWDLFDRQGCVCVICGREPEANRRLAVDHDHETGVVRGLLCTRCNMALGYLRDDPAAMRRAADYLEGRPWRREIPAEQWGHIDPVSGWRIVTFDEMVASTAEWVPPTP